jgi:hypothetical protein
VLLLLTAARIRAKYLGRNVTGDDLLAITIRFHPHPANRRIFDHAGRRPAACMDIGNTAIGASRLYNSRRSWWS